MRECPQCKKCYLDAVEHCPDDRTPTFHSIAGEPILEGKYKLECRIGQGGMGVVYKARHVYLKTFHAIKVILPDLVGNDPQLITRFHQEARASAAIRHHNVISVTDFGVVNSKMPFLVMEYVEGESLHELLKREKRLSAEKAVELTCAICAGVNAAHKQQIIHRDLKPLNIMICKGASNFDEAVKILDFGLAKIKSGELLGSFIQAQTTGLMGSPYYMAPEQWADEEPNAQSDIYSLGIMLFQMIAGDVPFKGNSIPAIMKKHLYDPPPSLAAFGVSVPSKLEKAIHHALEKDRQKRTKDIDEFVHEIKEAIGWGHISLSMIPLSPVQILSNSPGARVFVDGIAVGVTQSDGCLLIEGLQSGSHRIRVAGEGFQDWEEDIFCDGKPKRVIAELKKLETQPIHKPSTPLLPNSQNLLETKIDAKQPVTSERSSNVTVESDQANFQLPTLEYQPQKRKLGKPFALVAGILLIFLLGGLIGLLTIRFKSSPEESQVSADTETTGATPVTQKDLKPEMIKILGGTFKMGRNDGDIRERPEFTVTVRDFWIAKTEVTNAEYEQFVRETGYPAPSYWIGDHPPKGQEMMPVVYVDMKDIEEFIKWRSNRDGIKYRLPTEEEWEYAARNGSNNNLYPWGDKWENDRAAVEVFRVMPVGSFPKGANKWGVLDLIGNVWEWTSSKIKPYPGAKIVFNKPNNFVIRGGCFNSKASGDRAITSTTRGDVEPTRKDGLLGFRLASDAD
jgi:serine/threonine protein kinase